jgi:hypothetical protein
MPYSQPLRSASTFKTAEKSKALIPGAFGMRAKLAFVTRISAPIYRRGQQGENHTNSQPLMTILYYDFPVNQMNKASPGYGLSAQTIASSTSVTICGEPGAGLSK